MSYIWEFFFTQKTVSKTLLSSVFRTAFWVKKEFPNVTHKLISPPQAKKFSAKYGRWDKFSRRRENGHWDRKIGCLFTKKNGKIIVSVTVNSVASLQKNMSQWQTFGDKKHCWNFWGICTSIGKKLADLVESERRS